MNAVISNAKHPEYGQVTIPLPIPAGQYEYVLDLLDALKIGDTLEQDCQVDELPGCRPILKRLEGSSVNIDELDYLAKRLDSFSAVEDAQFQAMAVKLGMSSLAAFPSYIYHAHRPVSLTILTRTVWDACMRIQTPACSKGTAM